ncbi:MAG: glycosyltransferase family 2 protein [Candidatus Omnitrophica bacterium]|nr:glycosyltransferase family 2 protein [Candidatus Omnitrophota bacterium]
MMKVSINCYIIDINDPLDSGIVIRYHYMLSKLSERNKMIKASVSFVLPMFNEEDNISSSISSIKKVASELTRDFEIVVVDDASTDSSARIVSGIASNDPSVKLFVLARNTKFGGAFARGFKEARKDTVMYMDSDMPVSLEDIKGAYAYSGEFDIVTGISKVKKGDTLTRKLISGFYNLLVRTLFGLTIRDINSGFKIVKRDIVKDLEFISLSPFADVEIFLQAKRKNASIKQYPLIFRTRTGGKSYIARFPVILATFRDMFKVWFREITR